MSKQREDKWKYISKVPIPNSVTVISSSGPRTFTYAQARYKVLESRVVIENGGKIEEIREREEFTPPLYMIECPDLRAHFSVALAVLPELEKECFRRDK